MNILDIYAEIFCEITKKRLNYLKTIPIQIERDNYEFLSFSTKTGFGKESRPYISVVRTDPIKKYVVTETISAKDYITIRDVLIYKIYSQILLEYDDFARILENDANNILAFVNGENVDIEENSAWLFPYDIQVAEKMCKKRKKYEKHCTIENKYL